MEVTTLAAKVNFKIKRIVITRLITKPKRAAKIFGALSVFFTDNCNALLNHELTKLTGDKFSFVNALI
jgi:hypothetical protein